MAKKKRQSKKQDQIMSRWLSNQNRAGSKLQGMLPTAQQYRDLKGARMPGDPNYGNDLRRRVRSIKRRWDKTHSPTSRANALDDMFKVMDDFKQKSMFQARQVRYAYENLEQVSSQRTAKNKHDNFYDDRYIPEVGSAYYKKNKHWKPSSDRVRDRLPYEYGKSLTVPKGASQANRIKRYAEFMNSKTLGRSGALFANPKDVEQVTQQNYIYATENGEYWVVTDSTLKAKNNSIRGGRLALVPAWQRSKQSILEELNGINASFDGRQAKLDNKRGVDPYTGF